MGYFKKIASFIKVEHTLFSLPLLYAGALLAPTQRGLHDIPWGRWGLILLAGIGARAAALGINRILDRRIDALNPRTAGRELPSGALKLSQGWTVVLVGGAIYLAAAAALGRTCLLLSPVPLAIFSLYPLMKRFTAMAHFGVGAGLALAPLGGYMGVTDAFPNYPAPWWLAVFALTWVSGFDVLYATMDEAFDKKQGLYSIPSRFGVATAQDVALVLHAFAFFSLAMLRWTAFQDKPTWIWLAIFPAGILLALEQKFGYNLDAGSPFFKVNAWIGVAAFVYVLIGVL